MSAASRSLLLVDDDPTLCRVLARALEKRGYQVTVAHDVADAMTLAEQTPPQYAVVDLKMPGPSGLSLIGALRNIDSQTRIVMLTGYASISTSVEAIKLGAIHYLVKPVSADEIVAALHKDGGDSSAAIPSEPISVRRLEWEHL